MLPLNSESDVMTLTAEVLNQWKFGSPAADSFRCQLDASSQRDTGMLTLTWPRLSMLQLHQWLGQRVLYWPNGVQQRRRVAMVSSRLKQRRDLQTWWFDALRTAVLRSDFRTDCLCVADGTASSAAVTRASELFGIPRLKFHVCSGTLLTPQQLGEWIADAAGQWSNVCCNRFETSVILSPRYVGDVDGAIETVNSTDHDQPTVSALQPPMEVPLSSDARSTLVAQGKPPERVQPDAALVLAGEKLVSLYCRSDGNIEALLQRRLADDVAKETILLAVSVPPASRPPRSVLQQGAIEWRLQSVDGSSPEHSVASVPESAETAPARSERSQLTVRTAGGRTGDQQPDASAHQAEAELLADPLQVPEEWLCHWTRPAAGAWPGQSDDDFLDELILGCATADRSALARLLRILAEGCIRATSNRQHEPASVSFTAVPLTEFRGRRVFRAHRRRYDFEPWGVAVRRSLLQRLGAEAVRYLEPEELAGSKAVDFDTVVEPQTAPASKFTQPRWDTKQRMDWSTECEWRIAGDLQLNLLPATDVCLFVNDSTAAQVIAQASSWSVVIVPEADNA